MRIANRFAIAVHILSLLSVADEAHRSSDDLAASIGVNPVIVRNVMGMLRRADLVQTQQGVAGADLTRPLADITLLDVYRAVEDEATLFSMHPRPNPNCPVGANIQATLEQVFDEAQATMEARLRASTMLEVVRDIRSRAGISAGESA